MANIQHKSLTGADAVHPFALPSETDPGAIGAYKAWIRPSTGEIRVRDAANTGWVAAITTLATETQPGVAEVATQAEADTGADDARFVTPLKMGAAPLGRATHTVASEAAMLALSARKGDIAVRTDLDPDASFRLNGTDPTVLANWVRISFGGASVSAASESAAGIAEIATQAETDAGTDDARIVTPAKLAGRGFERTANKNAASGYPGLSATPGTPDGTKYLRDDGTWAAVPQGGHSIQDEGTALTQRGVLDFRGAGVTATDDGVNSKTVVTIPAAGPAGDNAYTSTTAAFTQPASGATVSVSVGSTAWMGVGQFLYVENGGYYTVSSITDATTVVLTNLGYTGNAASGTSVASGSKVSPGGRQGEQGPAGSAGASAAAPALLISLGQPHGVISWTNMPAALTEWGPGSVQINRFWQDLTNATEIRINAFVASSGASAAELRVQYSLDSGTTWSYADGADGPKVSIASAGANKGAWVVLAAAAKTDALWRIVGINGDGVADPQFGAVQVQAR